jgi:hypothetical protein
MTEDNFPARICQVSLILSLLAILTFSKKKYIMYGQGAMSVSCKFLGASAITCAGGAKFMIMKSRCKYGHMPVVGDVITYPPDHINPRQAPCVVEEIRPGRWFGYSHWLKVRRLRKDATYNPRGQSYYIDIMEEDKIGKTESWGTNDVHLRDIVRIGNMKRVLSFI